MIEEIETNRPTAWSAIATSVIMAISKEIRGSHMNRKAHMSCNVNFLKLKDFSRSQPVTYTINVTVVVYLENGVTWINGVVVTCEY